MNAGWLDETGRLTSKPLLNTKASFSGSEPNRSGELSQEVRLRGLAFEIGKGESLKLFGQIQIHLVAVSVSMGSGRFSEWALNGVTM